VSAINLYRISSCVPHDDYGAMHVFWYVARGDAQPLFCPGGKLGVAYNAVVEDSDLDHVAERCARTGKRRARRAMAA
jgi:hypothetical protein